MSKDERIAVVTAFSKPISNRLSYLTNKSFEIFSISHDLCNSKLFEGFTNFYTVLHQDIQDNYSGQISLERISEWLLKNTNANYWIFAHEDAILAPSTLQQIIKCLKKTNKNFPIRIAIDDRKHAWYIPVSAHSERLCRLNFQYADFLDIQLSLYFASLGKQIYTQKPIFNVFNEFSPIHLNKQIIETIFTFVSYFDWISKKYADSLKCTILANYFISHGVEKISLSPQHFEEKSLEALEIIYDCLASSLVVESLAPSVSVITPSFNQGSFLKSCLESLSSQTTQDFEHIVIDGASTDETLSILMQSNCLWVSEPDHGQTDALIKGIKLAQGEIIAWLNSDDYFFPHTLATIIATFESNPDVDIVIGNCELFYEHNGLKTVVNNPVMSTTTMLRYWNPYSIPTQPAIFIKKQLLESHDLDVKLNYTMDYDLWLKILARGKCIKVDSLVAGYRFHDKSKSGSSTNWPAFFPEWSFVFNRHRNKDPRLSRGPFLSLILAPIYSMSEWSTLCKNLSQQVFHELEVLVPFESLLPDASVNEIMKFGWSIRKIQNISHYVPDWIDALAQHARSSNCVAIKNTSIPFDFSEILKRIDYTKSVNLPLISIIIPAYNCAHTIQATLDSIRNQFFNSYEVIVVNDGSTDDSLSIISNYSIRYPDFPIQIYDQSNSGEPAIAKNRAIRKAQGQYILPLDSDDILSPRSLSLFEETLKREMFPANCVVYGSIQTFQTKQENWPSQKFSKSELYRRNRLGNTSLYSKSLWYEIGGYKTGQGYEDWEFWISCSEFGARFIQLKEIIYFYRISESNSFNLNAVKNHEYNYAQIIVNHVNGYWDFEVEWAKTIINNFKSPPGHRINLTTSLSEKLASCYMILNSFRSIFSDSDWIWAQTFASQHNFILRSKKALD